MNRKTLLPVAALLIAALVAGPVAARDTQNCRILGAAGADPAEMTAAWLGSLQQFLETTPDLSPRQRAVVARAVELGTQRTFSLKADPGHRLSLPELASVIREAQEVFTTNQLGQIFAHMGSTQQYLTEFAALSAAFCNCKGVGNNCRMPNGGPSGTCKTGCTSWTNADGEHYVAICTPVEVEVEPGEPAPVE